VRDRSEVYATLLIYLLFALLAVHASDVETKDAATIGSELTQLTPWNFDEMVGQEKNVLVMFYAPWCGGCTKFMPKYVQTARMLKDIPILDVVKADVTEFEYEVLQEFKVGKVPALKLFKKEDTEPMQITPGDPFDLHLTVKEKIGMAVPNKCLFGDSDAETVTAATWKKTVMDTTHSVLVQFYAPWCQHCKKMLPTYNNIARKMTSIPGIKAVRVNADADKELMKKYNVKLLPTFMIFGKQNKTGTVYRIPDNAESHLSMINQIITRLQQPDSTPEIEAEAEELLTKVTAFKATSQSMEALTELVKAVRLNITQVWQTSIVPLVSQLRESEATRLKTEASDMAGGGNFASALERLEKIMSLYGDTKMAKSEAVDNLIHNCKHALGKLP